MPGLVVLTGVARARDILASGPDYRPDYLGHDLRALHEPHPSVHPSDGGWACRDSLARVDNDDVIVTTSGTQQVLTGRGEAVQLTLDGLRAACGAVWATSQEFSFDRDIHIQPMR